MALSKEHRDVLRYSFILAESALNRAKTMDDRTLALHSLKAIIKNLVDLGLTIADAQRLFPTHKQIIADLLPTCEAEMGIGSNKAGGHDFNSSR